MTDRDSAGAAAQPAGGDEEMLTTGEAAEVIGYGTTRKRVDAMIRRSQIEYVRLGPGQWALIPMSAALAKRAELERNLAQARSRIRAQERLRQEHDD